MAHAVSLLATLIGLWLLLSGHYVPLIMGLGAASCFLVVFIAPPDAQLTSIEE